MALGSSQTHSELPSVQLKDFSFDLFFNLFLQSWPREEVADLFTMYSDNFSLMNHSGLVNFLQSTVSVSSFQKVPESSTTRQSRVTRPRKIKHVNLMHWEARHFYRTKSQKTINQPTQRFNLIPSSNNNLGTNRSRSEQRQSRSRPVTTTAVHSPRPLTHVNSQRQKQTVFPAIKLSQSEFRTIVQRYETDPVVRHQGRLSAQGFYRFLLSRDYLTLTRVRKFGEAPDQMQTMRCPFSHYYLQCAQIIVQPSPAPFEFNPQDVVSDSVVLRNKINYIRALRQLLLLGTRCLLLECFAKPSTQPVVPGPGRGRQAEPELFIFPSLMTDPSQEQNAVQETSMREAYAIPIEIVLDVIKKAAFLITPYPLVLVLRVQQLSAQDQCHLGGLLQEHFGEWLLCPPLPKFELDDAQANTILERYYGNSHQPMPSPESMKNKILLNLTRAENTFGRL
ncbi:1-phosphatidylinositol 4,5-bisphosphate phosphodiesterase beta-3, partial [Clonorchis sinensis]